jgi:hypothetical protein
MTLIDRLSKLGGPSGSLDREICKHLGLLSSMTCEYNHWPLRVTSSVDDAIALAERVLPGHQVNVTHFHVGHGEASIGNRLIAKPSSGSNPAIALCIAILRAKKASHGE